MKDIVELLREGAYSDALDTKTMARAADEIERLRATLRLIAWDVEGQEPDLSECVNIAASAINQ